MLPMWSCPPSTGRGPLGPGTRKQYILCAIILAECRILIRDRRSQRRGSGYRAGSLGPELRNRSPVYCSPEPGEGLPTKTFFPQRPVALSGKTWKKGNPERNRLQAEAANFNDWRTLMQNTSWRWTTATLLVELLGRTFDSLAAASMALRDGPPPAGGSGVLDREEGDVP